MQNLLKVDLCKTKKNKMAATEIFSAKGFLFDLNGTMVDDMPYHIEAWHKKIIELGGNLTLEEMKYQCYGKNDELLERVFPCKYSMEEKIKLFTPPLIIAFNKFRELDTLFS